LIDKDVGVGALVGRTGELAEFGIDAFERKFPLSQRG